MGVYRSLVVPIDGSALAERALRLAASLAARMQSELHLVHAYQQRVIDELPVYGLSGDAARNTAENFVVAAADRVRAAQGGVVTGAVLDGPPASAIVAYAASREADLIVMSSHGRTGASRFWLGSVTDTVMRSATVPVLMVRAGDSAVPGSAGLFERILVPLDGSARAEAVLPHAMRLAQLGNAHAHLLQVEEQTEDLRMSVWSIAEGVPDDLPARLDGASRYLHRLVEQSRPNWAPATVSTEARAAHRVGEAIAHVAAERDADLIAMTTHGRGASRLLLGSVADKVIRGTACSILLVRSA